MRNKRFYLLIVPITILLLTVEIAALAHYSHTTWSHRIGFILQIIGIYGIGVGFVQKSDALKKIEWLEGMSSPDPVKFLASNLRFLGLISLLINLSFSKRSENKENALGCLGQLLILFLLPFFFLSCILHLFLICPFAYFGYLISSLLVETVMGASDDIEIKLKEPASGELSQGLRIKEIIAPNPAATKSFLIGIPAILLAFVTRGWDLFF